MSDIRQRKYDENGQSVWDATSISAFIACERKWHFMNFVRPTLPKSEGEGISRRDWGTLIHDCLDFYYAHGKDLDATIDYAKAFAYLRDERSKVRNFDALLRTLVWYDATYADDGYRLFHIDGIPSTEARVEVPWLRRRFSAKFDMVLENEDHIRIFDHKVTSTDLNVNYFQLFKPDVQTALYFLMGKLLWGERFDAVVINAIRPMAGRTQFYRYPIRYTPSEMAEFNNLLRYVITESRVAFRVGKFNYRPTACSMYGRCDYLHICQTPPEGREF